MLTGIGVATAVTVVCTDDDDRLVVVAAVECDRCRGTHVPSGRGGGGIVGGGG